MKKILKRALVTGGAGFIGSHLVDQLIEDGYEVRVIDNLCAGKVDNLHKDAEFIKGDILDVELLNAVMGGVDIVFHLACLPRIQRAIDEPVETHNTNVTGTLNVLEAMRKNDVKKIIYSSSSSVYGEQETDKMDEGMSPNPLSMYAVQKLAGEMYVSMYAKTYDMSAVSLRYFNVYGPRQGMDGDYCLVLGKFLQQKKEGKPLTVYGDGRQQRAYTWVGDVVRANILFTQQNLPANLIVNIGDSKLTSVLELARMVGGEVEFVTPNPRGEFEEQAKCANYEFARGLGWTPTVELEEGIKMVKKLL